MSAPPKPGVWCPAVTFFQPTTEKLDLESQKQYFSYLSKTGLAGLVILGSNAEAFLLTHDEKISLMRAAREAVGPDFPLMMGVSGFSVVQVLASIQDAVAAGANYGLLLPAAYYGSATSMQAVKDLYNEVAQKSELPIVIYNFPGICNGVDLTSEVIRDLAVQNEGKIVGVKLTCGSVAKLTRLCEYLPSDRFSIFAGQSDWLLPGLAVGSAGCVSAFSNVFPKSCAKIYSSYKSGTTEQALRLQRQLAAAESKIKAGITPTKYAVSQYSAVAAGIGDAEAKLRPRRPYLPVSEEEAADIRQVMNSQNEVEIGL